MAITLSNRKTEYVGSQKVVTVDVAWDSSYPSDGEAVTLSQLGMSRLDRVEPSIHSSSGGAYLLKWNGSRTAPKLVVYQGDQALVNNTGGSASGTLAAGVGKYLITVPVNLATVVDGDVLTTMPIPHKFKILSVDAYVTQEVTTGAKLSTLNVEIGTTNLTGGEVALTSANCATLGAKVAGSAVTAANTGAADATISIEAASTTAFAEGQVMVVIGIQNMDTADAFASLVDDAGILAQVPDTTNLASPAVTGTVRFFGA